MTSQERIDNALELMRDLPAEVSMEDVSLMVAAFPAIPPASNWYQNFNLNSILMTTAGTLIVAGLMYFLASGNSQQPVRAVVAPTIENAVVPGEEPAEAMALPARAAVAETVPAEIEPATVMVPNLEVLTVPIAAVAEKAQNAEEVPVAEPEAALVVIADPLPEPLVVFPAQAEPANADMEAPVLARRTFDLSGFNAIAADGAMDVFISQGPFSVTADGDQEIMNVLDFVIKGKTLVISSADGKRGSKKNGHGASTAGTTVHVAMPGLNAVALGGSGTVDIQGFENTGSMDIGLSGSGDIHFSSFTGLTDLHISVSGSGTVNGDKAEVSGRTKIAIAGSGDVRIAGKSNEVQIDVSGSGDVVANELVSNKVTVSIAGSGDVSVNTNGSLTKAISGSGTVRNTGSGGKNSRSEDADEQ